MFENIPDELKTYAQWIVWKFEPSATGKPTKVPYSPCDINVKAKVTDPSTWGDFATAVVAAEYADGLGFVLTANDPYTLVDLDDTDGDQELFQTQYKIFERLDSYTEISPSGKGVHVIVKGHIPAGRKRNKIELYSEGRYMTMTGNRLPNAKPIIEERHAMANELFERLCGGKENVQYYDGNAPQTCEDVEIINRASAAENGDKFMRLHTGDWQGDYPSQSEADLSYVNMLAFYTKNREQITRIFKASPLGARNKTTSIRGVPYVDHMINKSFDRMMPELDMNALLERLEQAMIEERAAKETAATVGPKSGPREPTEMSAPINTVLMPTNEGNKASNVCPLPDGLMGEIAQYIYDTAPRPVPEIALAGAISLMAGICGRAFNTNTGTGLNMYMMLLAPSGRGKEAMASGISRLMAAIEEQCPTSRDFLGPSAIMSPQALIKHMNNGPKSFVSIIGEVGIYLKSLTEKYANAAKQGLLAMFLDMYGKSGNGDSIQPTIYADNAKNTASVAAPALTLLGESTQSEFYSALDETMINSGLLPRFMIIEYTGPRVPKNDNFGTRAIPQNLANKLCDLVTQASMLNNGNKSVTVTVDPEAKALFDAFSAETDNVINAAGVMADTTPQLWNRAELNALRLASLVAVGVNPWNPCVTLQQAEWAITLVRKSVKAILDRFDSGDVGQNSGEVKQINDLRRTVRRYVTAPYSDVEKYQVSAVLHAEKIVTHSYLHKTLCNLSSFRNDRVRPTDAIKSVIRTLIDRGDITEVPRNTLVEKYGFRGQAYMIAMPREFGF